MSCKQGNSIQDIEMLDCTCLDLAIAKPNMIISNCAKLNCRNEFKVYLNEQI